MHVLRNCTKRTEWDGFLLLPGWHAGTQKNPDLTDEKPLLSDYNKEPCISESPSMTLVKVPYSDLIENDIKKIHRKHAII